MTSFTSLIDSAMVFFDALQVLMKYKQDHDVNASTFEPEKRLVLHMIPICGGPYMLAHIYSSYMVNHIWLPYTVN